MDRLVELKVSHTKGNAIIELCGVDVRRVWVIVHVGLSQAMQWPRVTVAVPAGGITQGVDL